jgi:hypothetical protein
MTDEIDRVIAGLTEAQTLARKAVFCHKGRAETVRQHRSALTGMRRNRTMADELPFKITPELQARFWAKVDRRGPDDCWVWLAAPSSRGYGRIQTPASKSYPAHKLSHLIAGGSVKAGEVVDHTCRNRLCVNPAHLRSVPPRLNSIENSVSPTAINAAKTHCIHGHELTPDNIIQRCLPWRRCLECARRLGRLHYHKRAAAARLQEHSNG